MTKLPKFEGRLLTVPKLQTIDILRGNFAKAIDEKIQDKYAAEIDAIRRVGYDAENDTIVGSNIPYVIATNDFLPEGSRTITAGDAARAINLNAKYPELGFDFRGKYYDLGVVVRDSKEPNSHLAELLIEQAKERAVDPPFYAPCCGLRLEGDSKSDVGSFILKDNAQVIHADILNKRGHFASEDVDERSGLPRQTGEKGDRYLYTRNSGLSRLDLDGGLGLASDWGDLAGSDSGGRVAKVDEIKYTPQKFIAEITKFIEEKETKAKKAVENLKKMGNETMAQL